MDVHVPLAVTKALRERGVDVLTAQEDEAAQLDDRLLLQRSTELGRVLVTQDDDFLGLAVQALQNEHSFAGVIFIHQMRSTIGKMVHNLELISLATRQDEWMNRVEHLPL